MERPPLVVVQLLVLARVALCLPVLARGPPARRLFPTSAVPALFGVCLDIECHAAIPPRRCRRGGRETYTEDHRQDQGFHAARFARLTSTPVGAVVVIIRAMAPLEVACVPVHRTGETVEARVQLAQLTLGEKPV